MLGKNISNNIIRLRKKNNYSQADLATELNITRQSLSLYETEKRTPDIYVLAKLASIFNCTLDFLVFNSSNNLKTDFTVNSYLDKRTDELNRQEVELNVILNLIDLERKTIKNLSKSIDTPALETDISNFISATLENPNSENKSKEISRLKHSLKSEIGMIDVYMSGCVACGVPASPYTDFEEPMKLPLIAPLADGKEYFILHASGDSMNKIISDAEQMIIEQTQIIEDGDIAVFLINGECTLKEYESDGDSSCILKPLSTNPIHEDQYYESTVDLHVQGKYVCKVKDLLKEYDEIMKSKESL